MTCNNVDAIAQNNHVTYTTKSTSVCFSCNHGSTFWVLAIAKITSPENIHSRRLPPKQTCSLEFASDALFSVPVLSLPVK